MIYSVNIRIEENIEMCGVFVYIKLYKSRTKSTSNKVHTLHTHIVTVNHLSTKKKNNLLNKNLNL